MVAGPESDLRDFRTAVRDFLLTEAAGRDAAALSVAAAVAFAADGDAVAEIRRWQPCP